MTETDVIVIGSGIGGLCCGALLARYGFEVTVCESHSLAGGAAHGFEREGFRFDSGPSLYSGLSYSPSPNPLRQVLDALDEDLAWITYDTWGCCLPEGDFETSVGADQFCEVLRRLRGESAVAEWRRLQKYMEPLAEAAIALPPAALRADWGAVVTAGRYAPSLLKHLPHISKLTGSFRQVMQGVIQDPFIDRWLDMLCFLLSGLPADGTSAAEVAFMFADWYRPGVQLDYPVGGSGALVAALVRGLERFGGKLRLSAHVEQVLVEGDRAAGVHLRSGEILRSRRAVVSNASVWDTLSLIPAGALPQRFVSDRQSTPECESFMHLHLGIDGRDLPADLACHHIVVQDWNLGIASPQNLALISIPSLLDPTLAPLGKQVIHAYTPGSEPYDLWQGLDRRSEAYRQQKERRAEVLWRSLERVIPDVRSRCEVTLVGTPLTHERFLRRHRGSYGPALRAGQALFPGPKTPLPGLLCCGDSTFPGIGLPAVAASGMIAANTLAPIAQHWQMLEAIGC
ncbi:NAD(P)/FAD-dependent oxidoreductase [Geitlerinema sp. PCC 7407]|uniref:phytoene desaturase family protein n=1 Tax=Geitlerinema sp. PCC 7407 TaxID=1173025 RepID=UPI00029FDE99|nr:NAD(P)/FAD-dependent oxidoreductase [Geitlerinema sp. PCC 7407]AFY66509.1 FAD dependent oxidoreductase [Geitlerinema sp. PCC 7407]